MSLKHVAVVVALSLLAGCATSRWDVDAFEAPGADMAGRTSFFFVPGDIAAPLVRRAEAGQQMQTQVRAAIVEELQRKGYVEASDAASASVVVTFMAAATRKFVEPDQRRIGAPSPNEVLMSGHPASPCVRTATGTVGA